MRFKNFVLVVTSSVLSALSVYFLMDEFYRKEGLKKSETNASPVTLANYTESFAPTDFSKAAESTVHAVVHVKSIMGNRSSSSNTPFDFFWGDGISRGGRPMVGSGSGVIITKDGYVVTNNHVIDKSDEIEITLNNQKVYKATLVGTDPKTDIALLKIDAQDLAYISLANSDNLKIGEWVLAVGNPFNLKSTVTAGIVSALGRDISILGDSGIESFIQTDAVVNPGNSGGALVNTNGDLIGINTAISTHTGSFEGYSFAVPSNIVKKVVEDIIEYGAVQRAFLGVNITELNGQMATELGVDQTEGVYVRSIAENGFAQEGGLKSGDVIVKIDNKKIKNFADLKGFLASKRPGDMVNVKVYRSDKEKELKIKLSNEFGTTELKPFEKKDIIEMMNAKFEPLSDREKQSLGVRGGLRLSNVGDGMLKDAGIEDGFIILRVQQRWVNSKEDIRRIIEQSEKAVLMEVVNKRGRVDYYAVKL